MLRTNTFVKTLLLLLAGAVLAAVAYRLGTLKASEAVQESSSRQLQILAMDLEATLERYETLPYALALQSEALAVVQRPSDQTLINHLNDKLRDIARQAQVSAVYLMDRTGRTLATSNRNTEQDYTGSNFGFRPYFQDAMHGLPGRYYAIGSTTSEPGYFIAQPVYADSTHHAPVGVVAVKISLDYLARAWKKLDDPVLLLDQWDVIFLSNRDPWRYHSLTPLSSDAQTEMARSQQYIGKTIEPLSALPEARFISTHSVIAATSQPVGRLGWSLQIYPSGAPIQRAGLAWATVALMVYVVLVLATWARLQHVQRLQERGLARQALQAAADDLERAIAQRTLELTTANHNLQAKNQRLQETEHLLRNTQNELVQAGKLTMLGQMAAGVTHELSQPLTALRAFADNAKTFLARGQTEHVQDNLTHISAASARMGAIIGQLKGFARKGDEAVVAVDMAQSLRSSALMLEADFARAGAQLSVHAEPLFVTGDATRIEQVLINLLRNALDAVRDGPNKSVIVSVERDASDCRVRISDSGPGISDAVQAHLFEPFFSTKSSGGGLGLGLAISSSIVQALNGRLTAANHPAGGAQFTLWLPLAPVPGEVQSTP